MFFFSQVRVCQLRCSPKQRKAANDLDCSLGCSTTGPSAAPTGRRSTRTVIRRAKPATTASRATNPPPRESEDGEETKPPAGKHEDSGVVVAFWRAPTTIIPEMTKTRLRAP